MINLRRKNGLPALAGDVGGAGRSEAEGLAGCPGPTVQKPGLRKGASRPTYVLMAAEPPPTLRASPFKKHAPIGEQGSGRDSNSGEGVPKTAQTLHSPGLWSRRREAEGAAGGAARTVSLAAAPDIWKWTSRCKPAEHSGPPASACSLWPPGAQPHQGRIKTTPGTTSCFQVREGSLYVSFSSGLQFPHLDK